MALKNEEAKPDEESGLSGTSTLWPLKNFSTIFPLLTTNLAYFMLIVYTHKPKKNNKFLKSLNLKICFVISGSAVQIRPWAPEKIKGANPYG